jgi:hypothetical protein
MNYPGLCVKLEGQIVSRLGGGIVDAYPEHRKTALQFGRALLGTFPGAELCLQATIDFESETVFGQISRSDGHSETAVMAHAASR